MRVIKTRNVHDALPKGLDLLYGEHYKQDSRNGTVYKAKSPVCTVYDNPQERVMFWPERDANPFFHFMEGLWMLAGRNDLEFVKQYNKGMARYSDDGETLHGAYGWRWRNWFFERGEKLFERAEPTGKRIAIVGGGPAGLSCAHRLALLGHEIVIFEAREKLKKDDVI